MESMNVLATNLLRMPNQIKPKLFLHMIQNTQYNTYHSVWKAHDLHLYIVPSTNVHSIYNVNFEKHFAKSANLILKISRFSIVAKRCSFLPNWKQSLGLFFVC